MNGVILTVDARDSVASAIRIQDGFIVAVGDDVGPIGPDTLVVDLNGRTAIPGLIDSHVHFVQSSQAPGHFLSAIETSFSIAELQLALTDRVLSVPLGEFITAIGGLGPIQFVDEDFSLSTPKQPSEIRSSVEEVLDVTEGERMRPLNLSIVVGIQCIVEVFNRK